MICADRELEPKISEPDVGFGRVSHAGGAESRFASDSHPNNWREGSAYHQITEPYLACVPVDEQADSRSQVGPRYS